MKEAHTYLYPAQISAGQQGGSYVNITQITAYYHFSNIFYRGYNYVCNQKSP